VRNMKAYDGSKGKFHPFLTSALGVGGRCTPGNEPPLPVE
jgi:hypothetical protein